MDFGYVRGSRWGKNSFNLQGINTDSIFRNNESEESASFYTKNTFMGIQTNIEMTTPKKNSSQMIDMKVLLLGMSKKFVEIGLHNLFNIMKSIQHGVLKHSANVF